MADTTKICGIYKITNPVGNIYIGQSWNIAGRKRDYIKGGCIGQRKLYYSLSKYGCENHKFEVMYKLPGDTTQQVLDNYEIFCIAQYKCNYTKYKENDGLNLTDGGSSTNGHVQSEEQKKKNSINKSKQIYCFDCETLELKHVFPSRRIMEEKLNIATTLVTYVLRGRNKRSAKGYVFSYDGLPPKVIDKIKWGTWNKDKKRWLNKPNPLNKEIHLEKDGNILRFTSKKEAAKYIGIDYTTFIRYRNKRENFNGYKIVNNA